MRRNNWNNWKPPDFRNAVLRGGRQDPPGATGVSSVSSGQEQETGGGPEVTQQLANELVRQDRKQLAGDKQKMFKNQMQLINRRKTASKGNIVSFLFNERNAFINKQEAVNNVLMVSGFTPSNVLSLKLNDFRANECEVMFKDDVNIDCDVIEEKLKKKGLNVSVGMFIETEEVCMIYGLPLTSDVEGMKEQIRETINPFVRRVVSITATTHHGKNENDFFHGRYTGDYKVKVVPLNDGQIPYYVSIGDQHVMGKVHYVRKMMDKKVMCDACYSTEHVMRDIECPGVRDWSDYVRQFEEERDMAIKNFEVSSSGLAPAPSFVTRNAEINRLSGEVVDLQAKCAALESEKIENCKKMDEMMKRMSNSEAGLVLPSSEDSFNSASMDTDDDTLATPKKDGKDGEDAKRKNSGQNFEKRLEMGDSIWINISANDQIPRAKVIKIKGDKVDVEVPNGGATGKAKHSFNLSKFKWGFISN